MLQLVNLFYSDNRVIPDLDSQIGITVYSTNFDGIGGKIRKNPEDFQVTEIISEKAFLKFNQRRRRLCSLQTKKKKY